MRAPDPAPPPWVATCERDLQAMVDFIVAELRHEDAQLEELWDRRAIEASRSLRSPKPSFEKRLEGAKLAARSGELEPLRAQYPQIAEFIAEPKRKKGVRRPPHWAIVYGRDYTDTVASIIDRVRGVWKHQFGRWRRPATDNCMVRVVMAYLDLSEREVRKTMKSLSR